MLPKARSNARIEALQRIVDEADPITFSQWPTPREDDYVLIGGYIMLFNYIDLNLRRMAKILEAAKALPKGAKKDVAYYTISDVEKLLLSAEMSEANRTALENIREYRGMRNLFAHFAIKRFPSDDAYVS